MKSLPPLTDEQSELAAKWFYLACKIAGKWDRDRDSNRSDSGWASVIAALTWKHDVPFPRYLGGIVRRCLFESRRIENRQLKIASHLIPENKSNHCFALVDACEFIDSLAGDDDELVSFLIEGFTQTQIAEKMKVSQSFVSKQIARLRFRLEGQI